MKGKSTAIYVRVSTTKESQRDSPEHQRGLCEEKAKILDLDVQFVYEDRDSGTSIVGRPEIQNLIEDAKRGCFHTIIFASLSRFSRDTLDSLNLKRILVDALGLRLISIEESYDSERDNDELKFQIISAVNQKLSEQISISSKRGIRQSALKGNFTGNIPPFGYKKALIGGRKTLVPEESSKDIVKLIFELYINRKMGEKAIVKFLNEKEIASPKGGVWGVTSIQRILTNEVYVGENVFCKYELKKVYHDINNISDRSKRQVQRDKEKWERSTVKTHEPIIDEETFKRAQEIRLQRGGGRRGGVRNKVNVFAGFIFCRYCGSSMVVSKSNKGNGEQEYRYLICSARRRKGESGCINDLWIPYYEFRDSIIYEVSEKLKSIVNIKEVTDEYKGKLAKIGQLNMEKERKRIEKNIESNRKLLFEIRKQKIKNELDDSQYLFEKELYEKEISTLQVQLGELVGKSNTKKELNEIYVEIDHVLRKLVQLNFDHFDELQLVLKKLIDKIVVNKEGIVEIYTPLGQLEA